MLKKSLGLTYTLTLAIAAMLSAPCSGAADAQSKPLPDITAPGAAALFQTADGSSGQVTVTQSADTAHPGVLVHVAPGAASYPAAVLKPAGGQATWDLSAFDHVDVRVTNLGQGQAYVGLRIDNAGNWQDNPWNAEGSTLQPGQTATIRVIFGQSFGRPGYKLNPAAITQLMLLTNKTDTNEVFRVESITAGADAATDPVPSPVFEGAVPVNGVIIGPTALFEPASQIEQTGTAVNYDQKNHWLSATFSSQGTGSSVGIKPQFGIWDLSDSTEVHVKVTNVGKTSVLPSIQLISTSGNSAAVEPAQPIAPGSSAEIVVPFAAATSFVGEFTGATKFGQAAAGTGTSFASEEISSIKIGFDRPTDANLLIKSVVAESPTAVLPSWLGSRPPVPGSWVKTFDESFDSPTIDKSIWNIYGINPWDKLTHFSKDYLLLHHGSVTLRYAKHWGYQNDDPTQTLLNNPSTPNSTDYVCGYLDSSHHWFQRYGYFEAKVKLPTAPGLWPTFWMMPEDGDTGNNGMEFDIMEHLDRWGTHRYNIAMHWDGYRADHKSIGYPFNYARHDKDGYLTVGMLWEPGVAIYYCNGVETARWENPRIGSVPEYFIIENTSGGWDNNALDDSKLPADYTIEYVRAWQRADLASSQDSPPHVKLGN